MKIKTLSKVFVLALFAAGAVSCSHTSTTKVQPVGTMPAAVSVVPNLKVKTVPPVVSSAIEPSVSASTDSILRKVEKWSNQMKFTR